MTKWKTLKLQWVVLTSLSLLVLFFYQNCGQQGQLFGNCANNNNCDLTSSSALFINTSYTSGAPTNGIPIVVGKVSNQESSSAVPTYHNVDISGQCGVGSYSRHLIRWGISCTNSSFCTGVTPARGFAYCSSNGYSIRKYVRGLQTGLGKYALNIEIVGFDSSDNVIEGQANSKFQFPLNVLQTIQAPNVLQILGSYNFQQPIIVVRNNFQFEGLCDYQSPSTSEENRLKLKFQIPPSNITAGSGYISNGITSSDNIRCLDVSTQDQSIRTIAAANGNRTGVFNYEIPNIVGMNRLAAPFNCINCLEQSSARLLELELAQTDQVGSQQIILRSKKLFQFMNNNFFEGKGWSVETLLEIAKRIKIVFRFAAIFGDTSLDASDLSYLKAILTRVAYDAVDEESAAANRAETQSLRTYILNKMQHTEFAKRHGLATNKAIQALSSGNEFALKLKSIVSQNTVCGFNKDSNLIIGTNVQGDAETHKLALCLTRYFYFGLHNDPLELTRKITESGLNYNTAATCNFQDGTAAPEKYCVLVKQLLSNYSQTSGASILPLNANAANPLNSLVALKTKFLSTTNIQSIGESDPRLAFFTDAVVQLFTNAVMNEVSRHVLTNSVESSYFMEDVLDTIYQPHLLNFPAYADIENNSSYNRASKVALYNQLLPAEINYSYDGVNNNNFSAYTSRPERGSINAVGSLNCVVSANGQQCNDP